ncbi:MAG TPA: HD domain-containing protein [Micromonosporaceae bacterium]|nr:HD domain-containing protein [Micromonosporaceae bacterium]
MKQVLWARDLTRRLLAAPLPRRWAHSQGVGRKAESIAHFVGEDAEILVCAAWLHDVGYASALVTTGLHALDGARYLRDVEKADDRVCRLVAHHSCASIEAGNRGLAGDLAAEFPPMDGFLSDALTYCDMTTSPDGEPVDVEVRLAEILARYDQGDVVHRSISTAHRAIAETVRRVESAIAG